jgi:hypothetical protein
MTSPSPLISQSLIKQKTGGGRGFLRSQFAAQPIPLSCSSPTALLSGWAAPYLLCPRVKLLPGAELLAAHFFIGAWHG